MTQRARISDGRVAPKEAIATVLIIQYSQTKSWLPTALLHYGNDFCWCIT